MSCGTTSDGLVFMYRESFKEKAKEKMLEVIMIRIIF